MASAVLVNPRNAPETTSQIGIKPSPTSFDSGQEFSLEQLRSLYNMLESEDRELDGLVFDDACLRVA